MTTRIDDLEVDDDDLVDALPPAGGPDRWVVEEPQTRLDRWLAQVADVSRSAVAGWLADGRVTVDGVVPSKASAAVEAGAVVVLDRPGPAVATAVPQDIPLNIVYEDEDLIVVHKPSGLVVHPANGHPDGTLVNALLFHCGAMSLVGGVLRPGIVHRLDKETSGLLVASKNDETHVHLQAQFAAHTIRRAYLALAVRTGGVGMPEDGLFDTPHTRDPSDRMRYTGRAGGQKRAITRVRIQEKFADGAMAIICRLQTGRTHQIRMHLSEAGCPILRDPIYGGKAVSSSTIVPRLALHAFELGFRHRDGRDLYFQAPLPQDLADALARLRQGATWRG